MKKIIINLKKAKPLIVQGIVILGVVLLQDENVAFCVQPVDNPIPATNPLLGNDMADVPMETCDHRGDNHYNGQRIEPDSYTNIRVQRNNHESTLRMYHDSTRHIMYINGQPAYHYNPTQEPSTNYWYNVIGVNLRPNGDIDHAELSRYQATKANKQLQYRAAHSVTELTNRYLYEIEQLNQNNAHLVDQMPSVPMVSSNIEVPTQRPRQTITTGMDYSIRRYTNRFTRLNDLNNNNLRSVDINNNNNLNKNVDADMEMVKPSSVQPIINNITPSISTPVISEIAQEQQISVPVEAEILETKTNIATSELSQEQQISHPVEADIIGQEHNVATQTESKPQEYNVATQTESKPGLLPEVRQRLENAYKKFLTTRQNILESRTRTENVDIGVNSRQNVDFQNIIEPYINVDDSQQATNNNVNNVQIQNEHHPIQESRINDQSRFETMQAQANNELNQIFSEYAETRAQLQNQRDLNLQENFNRLEEIKQETQKLKLYFDQLYDKLKNFLNEDYKKILKIVGLGLGIIGSTYLLFKYTPVLRSLKQLIKLIWKEKSTWDQIKTVAQQSKKPISHVLQEFTKNTGDTDPFSEGILTGPKITKKILTAIKNVFFK